MSEPAGLYVHIPFCLTRCGYCDFNTYEGLEELRSPYVAALLREAELVSRDWGEVPIQSVFLGGGTPTTLPASTLTGLLGQLCNLFSIEPDAEVTVEANPDTIDQPYLRQVVADVTRLSIGVQSFDPVVLRSLDRIHSAGSSRRAFSAARGAGFRNVNLDLIYGADGETIESWTRTLIEAIALGPEHLSCYALTVEPNTLLGRRVAARIVPPPDPDVHAEMYETACGLLREAGFSHYEVSNWARPGFECLHNRGYWEGRPYLGLGAGAHSYRDGRRWWNVRPPAEYIRVAATGRLPVGGEEHLTAVDHRLERLLLGLRTAQGVAQEWATRPQADVFVSQGMAEWAEGRFRPTDRGMLLANELVLGLGE